MNPTVVQLHHDAAVGVLQSELCPQPRGTPTRAPKKSQSRETRRRKAFHPLITRGRCRLDSPRQQPARANPQAPTPTATSARITRSTTLNTGYAREDLNRHEEYAVVDASNGEKILRTDQLIVEGEPPALRTARHITYTDEHSAT